MIKAVILDFDDTTVMSEAACFELENAVLDQMGRAPMPRDLHIATWGRPLFEAIVGRSPGVDVSDFRAAYVPLIQEFVANGRLDAVPPEHLAAIDELRTSGKSILILTSREASEMAHLLIPGHELTRRLDGGIDGYYHKDNMEFHKPDPRAFAHIEQQHGWKPEECVYVGDSIGDAQSAKGAGLHFVASLESGLRTRQDFDGLPVDAFIHKFADLVEAVKKLDEQANHSE